MRVTPWGDADELRERRLPPGPGTARDAARRNQRERLFAAMIALVAERGYERTTLQELSQLSGVSRSSFYEHFADKRECFLAAIDAMVDGTVAAVTGAYRSADSPERRLRAAFDRLVELMIAQPAAARVWFVEAYAVGPPAVERHERAVAPLQQLARGALGELPSYDGMPDEIAYAIVGGMRRAIYKRLRRGEERALPALVPELMAWALSYEAPPMPLRRPRLPGDVGGPPHAELDQADRILRAVAECVADKGYAATTIADIAACAATSMRTFYAHFENKEEAYLAMIDWGNVRTYAAALPAYRRAPDWPLSVRNALHAVLAYLSVEPAIARAGTVEIYSAGARALDHRDGAVDSFERFLDPGFDLAPEIPRIAAEAIGGAVDTLLYRAIRAGDGDRVSALAPAATFIALAPFLGAQTACDIANDGGQPRRVRAET